jgi:hypothetical protein
MVDGQSSVEQFAAAGPYPTFHHRIHPGHPDAAEHNIDSGVGEDRVEQGRVLAVPVTDQLPHRASRVFQVHHQVAGGLGHPASGRVRGGTEDPDPAAGVVMTARTYSDSAGHRVTWP